MDKIELPMAKAMRTAATGKVVPLTPRLSCETSFKSYGGFDTRADRAVEVVSSVKFEMRQIASGDDREFKALQEQAIRAMMHEVYGPITERLHEIRVMLWEEGPRYDSKIIEAVDALFEATRGR